MCPLKFFGKFGNLAENWQNFCYLEKDVLELRSTATSTLRKIERSVFFYWTTTDKLNFRAWSWIHQMFGCGENVILQWKRRIAPPNHHHPTTAITRINPYIPYMSCNFYGVKSNNGLLSEY